MNTNGVILDLVTTNGDLGNYISNKLSNLSHTYTDYADNSINGAEQMAKQSVSAVTGMVENIMQTLLTQGIDAIYNALGINQESITLAQQVINISQGSIAQIQSIISILPIGIDVTPSTKACLNSFCASYKDMILEQYNSLKMIYNETIGAAITCCGNIIEVLKESVDVILNMLEPLLDPYVFQYTGYHIVEIMNMTKKGVQMLKAYRKSRKDKKIQEQEQQELQEEAEKEQLEQEQQEKGKKKKKKKKKKKEKPEDAIIEEEPPIKGNKRARSIKVSVNSQQLKQDLLDWLYLQSDALYNAFMMLNIKDMIMDIRDMVSKLTNISIKELTNNINSIDDMVNLLDELGLGDDKPGITLEMAITMGMNALKSATMAINSIKDQGAGLLNLSTATAIGSMVMANTKTTVNEKQVFDIKSEIKDDYTLVTITLYGKFTGSVQSDIKKILKNIKTNDEPVFSNAAIANILDGIFEISTTNSADPYIVVEGKVGKQYKPYYFLVICNQTVKKEENTNNVQDNSENDLSTSKDNKLKNAAKFFMSDIITEKTTDQEEKRRNTIDILKTIFATLKPLVSTLKVIATLIQNYKINKAKVQNHAHGNIQVGLQKIMDMLGLNKSKTIDDKNIFVVRRNKLYVFCIDVLNVDIDKDGWATINEDETLLFINKLNELHISFEDIQEGFETSLYFDMENINKDIDMLNNPDKYIGKNIKLPLDGTTNMLNKLCITDDAVLYTADMKDTMTSQIMRAIEKQYDPYENQIIIINTETDE